MNSESETTFDSKNEALQLHSSNDHLEKALVAFVEGLVETETQVTPSTRLESLELDSFNLMEIIVYGERLIGCKVPLKDLTPEATSTIEALANTLRTTIGAVDQ